MGRTVRMTRAPSRTLMPETSVALLLRKALTPTTSARTDAAGGWRLSCGERARTRVERTSSTVTGRLTGGEKVKLLRSGIVQTRPSSGRLAPGAVSGRGAGPPRAGL